MYKIAYALSNTHHIEYFVQKDYIDLPLLFQDIGRIYPPKNSSIYFKDDFRYLEITATEDLAYTNEQKILKKKMTD